MRKIFLFVAILLLCITPVRAINEEEPIDTDESLLIDELPDDTEDLLTDIDPDNLQFVDAVVSIFTSALGKSTDGLRQGLRTAAAVLMITLLCGICNSLSTRKNIVLIVGVLGIFGATLGPLGSMIRLSEDTIRELTDYSAVLLPIMASSMAISGNPITAGGLHGITALFAQLLMRIITKLLIPCIYLYLVLVAGEVAFQNSLLGELRQFLSWLMEKCMRILLYLFTIFLSLTGVISGSADALALKTTKSAVSGMVPVVGGILSDASESLLTGASAIKNSIGVMGLLAVLGITVVPFLRVGIQYLILKITAACSGAIAMKEHTAMLKHISTAMGLLLAMTGTCSALLMISGVCYLKVTNP